MRIILEDRKFIWEDEDIKEFKQLWEQGESLPLIALKLKCNVTDLALLIIDQAEEGKIEPRERRNKQ